MSRPDRILVCFATEQEAKPFRRLARILGSVGILITGMGPENAEASIRSALGRESVKHVISAGFAGGLDPKLPRGALVFETDDPEFACQISSLGGQRVRFHTAPRVAVTAEEKRGLREATGADAVEMESGAIRAVCRELTVPCTVARVISDPAGEDLPLDFNRLTKSDMRLSYLRLAGQLAAHPGRIARLRRFAAEVQSCARHQATMLASLIVKLRVR